MTKGKDEINWKARFKWVLDNVEEILCSFFLIATVVLLLAQVFSRFVLGKSVPFTEEMSRFTFLFMVYIATTLGVKYRAHIRVTAQFKLFSIRIQNIMLIFSDLLWLFFNCVVIYTSYNLIISMGTHKSFSTILHWDMRWIYLIIPLTFLGQIVRMAQHYYLWYKDGAKAPLISGDGEGI